MTNQRSFQGFVEVLKTPFVLLLATIVSVLDEIDDNWRISDPARSSRSIVYPPNPEKLRRCSDVGRTL